MIPHSGLAPLGSLTFASGLGLDSIRKELDVLRQDVLELSRHIAPMHAEHPNDLFPSPERLIIMSTININKRRIAKYQVCHACYVWLRNNVWGPPAQHGVLKDLVGDNTMAYNKLIMGMGSGRTRAEGFMDIDELLQKHNIDNASRILLAYLSAQFSIHPAFVTFELYKYAKYVIETACKFKCRVNATSEDYFIAMPSSFPFDGTQAFGGIRSLEEYHDLHLEGHHNRILVLPLIDKKRIFYTLCPYIMWKSARQVVIAGSEVVLSPIQSRRFGGGRSRIKRA